MNSLKTLFVLALLAALAITIAGATTNEEELSLFNDDEEGVETTSVLHDHILFDEISQEPTWLPGASRLLAQASRVNYLACDKYPRKCRAKGSSTPDCCRKKCVNVDTDRLNCGFCGMKCKFPEICCKGECVNPRNNKKHCGSCDNQCDNGSLCVYGMCSYA